MIFTKAAVGGITGVIGLALGITAGVTGAHAVASQHNHDKMMSHAVAHHGQGGHLKQQKGFTGNQQSGAQSHQRPATKGNGAQSKSDGITQQQQNTPNTNPAPPTK